MAPRPPSPCLILAALTVLGSAFLAGCNRGGESASGEFLSAAHAGPANAGAQGEGQDSPHAASRSRPGPAPTELKAAASVATSSEAMDVAPHPDQEEALFAGWPKPRAVLFITGQQLGYIEPCGCTGLVNQKGGLSRRYTLARQLADRGWPLVPVDVGNQVRTFGRQSEVKFQVTVDGMKKMGYRAIAFGAEDLRMTALELYAAVSSTDKQKTPFVSANTSILDPDHVPKYQIVEAGGKRIGITAVLGSEWKRNITSSEITLRPPEEALREVVPKLQQQKCDVYVLLAHASIEDSQRLAAQFPVFQIVVTAGGVGDPTYQPDPIPGTNALLVQVGVKGMYVGVMGIFDGPKRPYRYQRVPLDARFPDAREMLQLLASYQEQLREMDLDGLGLRPVPYPTGKTFIGSQACKPCHGHAHAVWARTDHAHALESLVEPGERSEVPRHFDPECISCHVIGWNPQKYFPYTSGYLRMDKTPAMCDVGCENCHGPGAEHVAAETLAASASPREIDALRAALRLPLAEAEKKCLECHDLDNSLEFHTPGAFDRYWAEVAH